jgi:hypothetical protein
MAKSAIYGISRQNTVEKVSRNPLKETDRLAMMKATNGTEVTGTVQMGNTG